MVSLDAVVFNPDDVKNGRGVKTIKLQRLGDTTESWKDHKDGSVRIDQTIFVERESQKGIVIGKGGLTIKAIGEAARHEMEEIFGRRVHLFLHSKVAERWGDSHEHYREWGLEYPKDQ